MSTTAQIVERLFNKMKAEFQRYMPSFNPNISGKTATKALAIAIAPEFKNLELYGEQIAQQATPLQADSKSVSSIGSLEDWGVIKLGRLPNPATQGIFTIAIVGTAGGTYLTGTQFTSMRTGQAYILQSEVVVGAGQTVFAQIKSVAGGVPVGLAVGDIVSSQQIVSGINSDSTVTFINVTPVNGETIEEYRSDIIDSFQLVPRGGTRADFVSWASEVSGVKKAYPYAGGDIDDENGRLGGAFIYLESTSSNGVPSQSIIDQVVQKYNDKAPIVACYVTVIGIIQYFLDVKIISLVVTPENEAVAKSLIEATIEAYFSGVRPFLDGVDREIDRNDLIQKGTLFGQIQQALSGLATVGDIDMTDSTSAIIISHQMTFGQVPFLDEVTYA